MRAYSRVSDVLRQAVGRILESRIVGTGVLDEPGLVELRSAGNQGGDERGSHTAAHIAHEIDDTGYGVILLRRNSDVSHEGNRHKQKAQTNHLSDAQQSGGT